MGDTKYYEPPYGIGECASFKIPYKTQIRAWQNWNKIFYIDFAVMGKFVFVYIPPLLRYIGRQGVTYTNSSGESYEPSKQTVIKMFPQTGALGDVEKRMLKTYVCPASNMVINLKGLRYCSTTERRSCIFDSPCRSWAGRTFACDYTTVLQSDGAFILYCETTHMPLANDAADNVEFGGILGQSFFYVNNKSSAEATNHNAVAGTNINVQGAANTMFVQAMEESDLTYTEDEKPFPNISNEFTLTNENGDCDTESICTITADTGKNIKGFDGTTSTTGGEDDSGMVAED